MDATKKLVTLGGLVTGNALTLVATHLWMNALRTNGGVIKVNVNAVGEGWIEVALFALGWALTVLGVGAVLFTGHEEPQPDALSWATVEEV